MTRNAIILAAGKSNRFAPITYERPKDRFCVKGEILTVVRYKRVWEDGQF